MKTEIFEMLGHSFYLPKVSYVSPLGGYDLTVKLENQNNARFYIIIDAQEIVFTEEKQRLFGLREDFLFKWKKIRG